MGILAVGCGEAFTAAASGKDGGDDTTSDAADRDAGTATDAAIAPADAGDASDDAPTFVPGQPVTLDLVITNDADDAVWINGTDERTSYSDSNRTIEVGNDSEMGRIGLRFTLPAPRGSTIDAAQLRLTHVDGTATTLESMQVQVYDTTSVPPFDGAHTHVPADHAAGGLWKTAVTGYACGTNGPAVSPELKTLVQHVIDRTEWQSGATVGFVLSPDKMVTSWAGFADSSSGSGAAVLHLVFTPH